MKKLFLILVASTTLPLCAMKPNKQEELLKDLLAPETVRRNKAVNIYRLYEDDASSTVHAVAATALAKTGENNAALEAKSRALELAKKKIAERQQGQTGDSSAPYEPYVDTIAPFYNATQEIHGLLAQEKELEKAKTTLEHQRGDAGLLGKIKLNGQLKETKEAKTKNALALAVAQAKAGLFGEAAQEKTALEKRLNSIVQELAAIDLNTINEGSLGRLESNFSSTLANLLGHSVSGTQDTRLRNIESEFTKTIGLARAVLSSRSEKSEDFQNELNNVRQQLTVALQSHPQDKEMITKLTQRILVLEKMKESRDESERKDVLKRSLIASLNKLRDA